MPGIFRSPCPRASQFAAVLIIFAGAGSGGAIGCGRPARSAPSVAPATSVPFWQALVLATAGATPHDTVVTIRAGEPRTIVLRHPAPDQATFAEVAFAPSTFAADSGRDVTVRLHPRPGVYGLDVETSASIGKGATVMFNYSRFFSAPAEARAAYGSNVALERVLTVAGLQPDSLLRLLPSARPAADHLQAPLPSAGTYFVVAPR